MLQLPAVQVFAKILKYLQTNLKKVSPGNLHLSNYKEKDFHVIVL